MCESAGYLARRATCRPREDAGQTHFHETSVVLEKRFSCRARCGRVKRLYRTPVRAIQQYDTGPLTSNLPHVNLRLRDFKDNQKVFLVNSASAMSYRTDASKRPGGRRDFF